MFSLKNSLNFFVSSSGKLFLHQPSRKIATKCGNWRPGNLLRGSPVTNSLSALRTRTLTSTTSPNLGSSPLPESRKLAQRGEFSQLHADDISFFCSLLGKNRVLTNSSDVEGYNHDQWGLAEGHSRLVLRPRTTSDVSKIMEYCYEKNLAVVPQGGNTGIAAGALALHDEIIISTSLMNQIEDVDEWSGVLVCQSGCILDKLNEHLDQFDLIVPLDLGAKESCQIGGNVSTNAGGLRVIRYGSLHSSVIGLEAVLPDGTVLDCVNTMKKDNTGYDLKHLFIGSEGTLGIVTKVAIQCVPKPKAVNLAFLGINSFQNVLEAFRLAKKDLGEILSACEYVDHEQISCVVENLSLKSPIEEPYPFYLMIETSGANAKHDEEKLTMFLEHGMEKGFVADGTIASQPSHIKSLWTLRERFPDALRKDGHFTAYDFSIPIENFDEMVQETRAHLGPLAKRVTGFGHFGDSNLHLNVTTDAFSPEMLSRAEPFVYNWVAQKKGSISSEHGLGSIKRDYIYMSKSPQAVHYMREMKKLLDPKGILNPYKVIPTRHH